MGGEYHFAWYAPGGQECAFRGRYLEIERPTRTVATWLFEGWPADPAIQTVILTENGGVTTMTDILEFESPENLGDHFQTSDGAQASWDKLEDLLADLQALPNGDRDAGTADVDDRAPGEGGHGHAAEGISRWAAPAAAHPIQRSSEDICGTPAELRRGSPADVPLTATPVVTMAAGGARPVVGRATLISASCPLFPALNTPIGKSHAVVRPGRFLLV